jgi:hypothetical protein
VPEGFVVYDVTEPVLKMGFDKWLGECAGLSPQDYDDQQAIELIRITMDMATLPRPNGLSPAFIAAGSSPGSEQAPSICGRRTDRWSDAGVEVFPWAGQQREPRSFLYVERLRRIHSCRCGAAIIRDKTVLHILDGIRLYVAARSRV